MDCPEYTSRLLLAAAAQPEVQAGSTEFMPTAWMERFPASAGEQLSSYRALRTLEAEARGGNVRARMVAWTSLGPDGGFAYDIVEEEGSDAPSDGDLVRLEGTLVKRPSFRTRRVDVTRDPAPVGESGAVEVLGALH